MNELPPKPIIVAFISDLFFATHIEAAAEKMGFVVNWIEDKFGFCRNEEQVQIFQSDEYLEEANAVILDVLTRILPALLIFDLSNLKVPWQAWLATIKSVPATHRIPVICFGAHEDIRSLREAKAIGAEIVVTRSNFINSLPRLIKESARIPDHFAINDACNGQLSAPAITGLEQFNRGEYFEAHESLEVAWNQDQGVGRELYRAILQIAVAYLQIQRGNFRGALKMFLRVRQWIIPLPEVCRGINVEKLRFDAEQVYQELIQLGPSKIDQFDQLKFKRIDYSIE